MTRDDVMRWVAGYERAWRDQDAAAVAELFSATAEYLRSPYEPPLTGIDAITAFWLDDDEDGEVFTMQAEPVAVDGRVVGRVLVHYGDPLRQEYRDLWVLRFDADGRVERFEEWPFWPGQPYFNADPPPESSR